jgi:O-antigen/teichoic acid export membrane protein
MVEAIELPKRSAGQGLVFAGAWSIGGKLTAKLIDLATLIILTGILDPEDFGLVAMAMAVIVVIEAITSVPIEAPILRIKEPQKEVYDTAFTLTVLRAGTILVIVAALSVPLSIYFDEERLVALLLVLCLAPCLRGCLSPRMASYVRHYNMRPEAFMDVTSKAFSLIAVTLIAMATKSYWSIVAGTVLTTLVLNLMSYWYARYRPRLTLSCWKQFADIVTWNTAAQFFEAMNWQLDQLLLGRYLTVGAFGTYSVSRALAEIPEQAAVLPLKRPMVSAFTQARDPEVLRSLWVSFSNGVFFSIAPFLVLLAMMAPSVVFVVLGPGWEASGVFVASLALAVIPSLPSVPFQPLAVSIFKTKLVTLKIVVQFAFTVPLVTLAVIYAGAIGAIIAKGLVGLAMTVYVASLVRKHIGLSLWAQSQAVWRTSVSLVAMGLVIHFFGEGSMVSERASRLTVALQLIGTSFVGLFVYLAASLLLWGLSGRPRGIEQSIFRLVLRRRSLN